MGGIPDPDEAVPEFVIEVLDEQSPETLDAIVAYLDGTGGIEPVPSQIVEAASMQDEHTVDEIVRFSEELAAFYRSSEHDSFFAAVEAADDGDEDGDGETTTLRHGGL